MGSFDGAEMYELVVDIFCIFLVKRTENRVGLYHDDGLSVNNTLCGKLASSLESPVAFDE